MSVAQTMLKEIVSLAKKLAVQEHENRSLWDSNMQIKQVRDLNAQRLRETEQELQRLRQRHVEVQSEELAAARAEITTLQGAMAADDKRLRDAEERVWPGETRGCDAPDAMADEILHLRQKLAAAEAAVSLQRAGIERLNAFVGKVRSVIDNDCDGLEIDEMIKALGELDGEPAPATELDEDDIIDRVDGDALAAGITEVVREIVEGRKAKAGGNSSATLTGSPEPEGGQ